MSSQRSNALYVGDCALQILQRLSGRSFQSRLDFTNNADRIRAQMKHQAEAWWNTVQTGEEAEILDREISSGGGDGNPERLAAIAPERVVPAIERGLMNADKAWRAESLLTGLVIVNTEPARAVLRRMVTKGRSLSTRMKAAEYVNMGETNFNGRKVPAFPDGDQRAARLAMLMEWKNYPNGAEKNDSYLGSALADLVIEYALHDLSMLPAIRAELPKHTADLRAKVFVSLTRAITAATTDTRSPPDPAVERFLAEQLEDVEYTPEILPKDASDVPRRTARVADMAADLLHKFWPDRYSFTWSGKREELEKARLGVLHAWRTTHDVAEAALAAPEAANHEGVNIVTRVTMATISQPLPAELQSEVDSWVEKSLNPNALGQFLADFAAENADDARSIGITARRDAGTKAIDIELMILPGQPTMRNPNYCYDVSVGGKKRSGEPCRIEHEVAQRPDVYGGLKSEITAALTAPLETAFSVHVVRLGHATSKP
jgi:hypothetical protein